MKDIKPGDVYFYNNGKVTILKVENEDFVLVVGDKSIHTEINGSEFCQACMIGGGPNVPPLNHKCGDVQDWIDAVLEDISNQDIFWVNVKHLQEKPFEFKKWQKICDESKKIHDANEHIKEKIKEREAILCDLDCQKAQLIDEIAKLQEKEKELFSSISENQSTLRKIIAEKDGVIEIKHSNVKISVKNLLGYVMDSLTLKYLQSGGVDNWEWYGESLPDDAVIENEALETIFSMGGDNVSS